MCTPKPIAHPKSVKVLLDSTKRPYQVLIDNPLPSIHNIDNPLPSIYHSLGWRILC